MAVDARVALLVLGLAATGCASTATPAPTPSPTPSTSQSAVVADYCDRVAALAAEMEQLKASPDPQQAREVAGAARTLTRQAADVSAAVVSDPTLTEQVQGCTEQLRSLSSTG